MRTIFAHLATARTATATFVRDHGGPVGIGIGLAVVFVAVGGPAGVASYKHAAHVFEFFGERDMSGWLPLTTDGMLVLNVAIMYVRRFRGVAVGKFLWLAFGAGMLATVGANLAVPLILDRVPGQPVDYGAVTVSLWPPVCFALTLELASMLIGDLRKIGTKPTKTTKPRRTVADEIDSRAKTTRPAKRTATSTSTPKVTDDDIIAKVLANLTARTAEAVPAKSVLRTTYGLGVGRAERIRDAVLHTLATETEN